MNTHIIDEGGLVNVVNTKSHLWLMVNKDNNTVFRSEEFLVFVGGHDENADVVENGVDCCLFLLLYFLCLFGCVENDREQSQALTCWFG